MSSMTEEFSRMADAMAEGHQQRSEMGMRRRSAASERHSKTGAMLQDLQTSRAAASQEQRTAAAEHCSMRRHDVMTLMARFGEARDAGRELRLRLAAAGRAQAADFMRELTSGVAAMRDAFSASQESRAMTWRGVSQALHERLAAYAQDRHGARMAFGGARPRTPGHHESSV